MSNFTNDEIRFFMDNYPKYGPLFCSKESGKPIHKIYNWAKSLGIKKIGADKHPSMQKVDPRQFLDIKTKEVAYFLGFFWADGFIHYAKNKTSNNYTIALEIVSEDFNDLSDIFFSLGKWATNSRKRCETWKETTTMTTNSKDIYTFLKENGYDDKSFIEPSLILQKIPDHLVKYFWRGFFDGDGSFNFNLGKERKGKCLQFSSTLGYKWNELSSFLDKIGASSKIHEYIGKRGSASVLNITAKESMIKAAKFLLSSEIGLTRKTNKMIEFLEKYEKKS